MLREKFASQDGRRELAQSVLDKRLLANEARRRQLQNDPQIETAVQELEDRLLIQALMTAEEKAVGAPSEKEQRRWYEENKKTLLQPERMHLLRATAAFPSSASKAVRLEAKHRAENAAARLKRNEPPDTIVSSLGGPSQVRVDDIGFVARADLQNEALKAAVFSMRQSGEISAPVETKEGFVVAKLVERRDARIPPFEEVRSEVAARLQPQFKREVFNQLVVRLRKAASAATVEVATAKQ
jgi:parvulin-like peptidyl-prolyl isomerase